MLITDENSVKKHIKAADRQRVYFIYGDEGYLTSFYASSLASSVADTSGTSFNYYYFNSETVSFDAVYEACETLPVMSDKVCVFIKDFPLMQTDAEELKCYTEYFPSLPDTAVLIFLMENTPVDDAPHSKWRQFIDAVNKDGAVFRLSKRSESSLTDLLVRSAAKRNASIDRETAQYFISVVGSDMQTALNEFDKLCAYASGPVTKEMIDEISVKSVEASVFDLTDAVNSRENDRAYEILMSLIRMKTEPTVIIGTIAFSYTDIYRVKVAEKYKKNYSSYLTAFRGYKNKSFRLDKASRGAKNFSLEQIKEILKAVSEADIKIKSFSVNNNLVLEELLARLMYIVGDKNAQR